MAAASAPSLATDVMDEPGLGQMPRRPIEIVLKEHATKWMSIPGVVGCGIGARGGRPCVTILVAKLTKQLTARLPKQVAGYPVFVRQTGKIRAMGAG